MPITADALRLKYAEYKANEEAMFQKWMTTVVPKLEASVIAAAESGNQKLEIEMPGKFEYKRWNNQELSVYIGSLFPGCAVNYRTGFWQGELYYNMIISWEKN